MNIGFLLTEIIALFSMVGLALLPLALRQIRNLKYDVDA